MARRRITRREFIGLGDAWSAVGLVAACAAPPAAPAPTTKPAAALPAPTSAPAKPAAEAPKPATAAPTAAPKPAGAPKPTAVAAKSEERLGRHLIGRLEGAEVVSDPAKLPKQFKEAPMLAELVKAGTLPPVEQRLAMEPMVIQPLHEIGKYGGTWTSRSGR
jgi:hypothetical protein